MPAQAHQFVPDAVVRAEPPAVQEDGEIDGVAVPVVDQVAGFIEQRLQGQRPQHERQCGQDQQPGAAQAREGIGQATQDRAQGGEHHRVAPQVDQVPQVVPGEAMLPAVEGILRPLSPAEVIGEEVQVAGFDCPVGDALHIRLHGHHHQAPEGQRKQQSPAALGDEAAGARVAQQEMHGQAGDQEDQVHPPAVHEQHRDLQPFAEVAALEVPVPVLAADVQHAPVVEDEQGESEGAQGIDVVAALVHGGSPWLEWPSPWDRAGILATRK